MSNFELLLCLFKIGGVHEDPSHDPQILMSEKHYLFYYPTFLSLEALISFYALCQRNTDDHGNFACYYLSSHIRKALHYLHLCYLIKKNKRGPYFNMHCTQKIHLIITFNFSLTLLPPKSFFPSDFSRTQTAFMYLLITVKVILKKQLAWQKHQRE